MLTFGRNIRLRPQHQTSHHDIGDEATVSLYLKPAPRYQIQPRSLSDATSIATGSDTLSAFQLGTTSINDADGPPTFDFTVGSRVIEYQAPRSRRQR